MVRSVHDCTQASGPAVGVNPRHMPVAEMRLVALQVAASWALRGALGKVDVSGSQVGIDALSWSVRYGDPAL